jgi:hopanoid biosynthesis associated RND transporter like protein HpnN
MVRYYAAIIAAAMIFTAGILFYCADNFRINTDLSGMISDKLHFRQLEKELFRTFPDLTDTIVVVINAEDSDKAISARDILSDRIRKDKDLFKSIYVPGGGSFFEKNGLLYLDVEELEKLSEHLAEAQPLMGLLSRDFSLRGLFGVLETALKHQGEGNTSDKRLIFLIDRMRDAFDSAAGNREYHMPWEGMILDEKDAASQRRQFIIIKPYFDAGDPASGESALQAVRTAVAGAGFDKSVSVRITGDIALAHDDYLTVRDSVGIATLLTIALVGLILFIGLGSGRLVFASLLTLMTGLIWTTGFAILAIGSLNLISVTFAVLFIGLGIDYSIQFCLRYRELIENGADHSEAIMTTALGVGRGLLLSCITTAIGFYAFLPTPYAGVAELGLISGTGMFISFIINLTLLPALLTIMPLKKAGRRYIQMLPRLTFPYRNAKTVGIVSLVLGLGAALFLPRVYFDYNPLNLYDQSSESIVAIKQLFDNTDIPPWTISILANGESDAKIIAERLSSVNEVKATAVITDFVPDKQPEKLGIISDIALFMQKPGDMKIRQIDYNRKMAALDSFERSLEKMRGLKSISGDHIGSLLDSIRLFRSGLKTPEVGKHAFDLLENGLLSGLPGLLKRLDRSLHPSSVKRSDIPDDIARQYVSPEGIFRVQVFPKENMLDIDSLTRFVSAVRSVAPDATDAPVTIYETGRAVTSSFRLATLLALVAVIIVLLAELRGIKVTALILLPLTLAILLTAAFSVVFSIPLNYANVIVLPLLIGVGVHGGIMFMIRHLSEPPDDGNMLGTSTARAIFLSSVTMMISTGTLVLSSHRGISGMGALLTVCFAFLLVSILILLPALTRLFQKENSGIGSW